MYFIYAYVGIVCGNLRPLFLPYLRVRFSNGLVVFSLFIETIIIHHAKYMDRGGTVLI
jgi:hypothetical protein